MSLQKHIIWILMVSSGLAIFGILPPARLSSTVPAQEHPPILLTNGVQSLDRRSETILPLLRERCFDCHAEGGEEGGVTFDSMVDEAADDGSAPNRQDPKLWQRVLKQIRFGLMPPPDEAEPLSDQQRDQLESWIVNEVFHHDETNPDPGRVTVRRLNRIEYRNTIRDLLNIDFDTNVFFPTDDAGAGFDNVGDVLTISPLLMEKYLDAAHLIVSQVVPKESKRSPRRNFKARDFDVDEKWRHRSGLRFSFYDPATAKLGFDIKTTDDYELDFDLVFSEDYIEHNIDLNRCQLTMRLDDELLLTGTYSRNPGKSVKVSLPHQLAAGQHELKFELQPLTNEDQGRKLKLQIQNVALMGPLSDEYQIVPKEYAAFFSRSIPDSETDRREYATELLRSFANRAYRRTVDDETLSRLVDLAQFVWQSPTHRFEDGIEQAMIAVLASPRFLFREEYPTEISDLNTVPDNGQHPLIDEYSLATRLSYFLWSTMPDNELLTLAAENKLREHLDEQIERMKNDSKFRSFYRNFVGQWLRTRDVEGVTINSVAVTFRESGDAENRDKLNRYRELQSIRNSKLTAEQQSEIKTLRRTLRPIFDEGRKAELTGDLRRSMRQETERMFEYVMTSDRSLDELIDCNYSFLDERLAKHYGIEGVEGNDFRKIELPAGNLRGGLLGHGSFLTVTSNPDRTSPVKRGLFLLENILGLPTGAPPPETPALEESESSDSGDRLALIDALAKHREDAMCSSCHNRMDPLGLALENFDPLGRQRADDTIDVSGELFSGETFANLPELKTILARNHRAAFYRCLAEKMMTFAIGRSLDYYDVPTVDRIVNQLMENDGKGSELLRGVINSVAFQKMRNDEFSTANANN